MTKRIIFPRGFEVANASDVDAVRRNDGDEEVETLFRIYANHEEGFKSWNFRTRVFKVAKRLMGNTLTGWAGRHQYSPYLHYNARNFMKDTIHFIETGRRTVHPRNWLDLLETNPKALPAALVDDKANLPSSLIKDSDLFLTRWVSHRGGFEDLLLSLVIMYGPGLPSTRAVLGVDHVSPKNPKLQALTAAITRNIQPPEEYN